MLKKAVVCGAILCFVGGYTGLAKAADPSLAQGKALYNANCMICHGAQGNGQGPAAMTLSPHPQSFVSKKFWQTPNIDTVIAGQVKNGKGQMPAFPNLSKNDVQSIIMYLKNTFAPK